MQRYGFFFIQQTFQEFFLHKHAFFFIRSIIQSKTGKQIHQRVPSISQRRTLITVFIATSQYHAKTRKNKNKFTNMSYRNKNYYCPLKKSALKMTKRWQWPVAAKKVKCPWKQHSVTTKWTRKCHYVKKHEPKESRTIPEPFPKYSWSIPDVS